MLSGKLNKLHHIVIYHNLVKRTIQKKTMFIRLTLLTVSREAQKLPVDNAPRCGYNENN